MTDTMELREEIARVVDPRADVWKSAEDWRQAPEWRGLSSEALGQCVDTTMRDFGRDSAAALNKADIILALPAIACWAARIAELEGLLGVAGRTVDVADRLIERSFGVDTPDEWHKAFRDLQTACAALRKDGQP